MGVATQPILTFYAVSQLGRAIAAASTRLVDSEYRLEGHGLDDRNVGMTGVDLASIRVNGQRTGSFPSVARALASCPIRTDHGLGLLWGLVPDGDRFGFPGLGDRRPLVLSSHENDVLASGRDFMQCRVQVFDRMPDGRNPAEVAELIAAPSMTPARIEEQVALLTAMVSDYPDLRNARLGYSPPLQPVHISFTTEGVLDVPLRLPKKRDEPVTTALESLANSYHGVHRVYPDLDGCGEAVHPLMLWWAVLYVLSRLARYLPNEWERLIDVGTSQCAVAIEYLLDEAQVALPELAITAIERASSVEAHRPDG